MPSRESGPAAVGAERGIGAGTDLPDLAARFAVACQDAGLRVGPDRTARFARALVTMAPTGPAPTMPITTRRLRHCAAATLISDPTQLPILDRVFSTVFGNDEPDSHAGGPQGEPAASPSALGSQAGTVAGGLLRTGPSRSSGTARDAGARLVAAAAERLAEREFEALSPPELARLAAAMRKLRVVIPQRRCGRTRPAAHGQRIDLRSTLRAAGRTAGDPVRLTRRRPRSRPRRLVVLCDISGSMEPYSRALIQFLYCAAGTERAEVFTFATRLTRLTRALARATPASALERAGRLAPDWSGGTRIGKALRRFNDEYGRPGTARGAVVLIVSDGWDTGDPCVLAREMARLRAVAYRVVWANPRTRLPGYEPLAGGIAAALPHCDAMVSAHSLDAMGELLEALTARNTGIGLDAGRRRGSG